MLMTSFSVTGISPVRSNCPIVFVEFDATVAVLLGSYRRRNSSTQSPDAIAGRANNDTSNAENTIFLNFITCDSLQRRSKRGTWGLPPRPLFFHYRCSKICVSGLSCAAPNPSEDLRRGPFAQIIKVGIDNRRDQQSQQQAQHLPADDRDRHCRARA